jgi:hypothetical protein
MSSGVFGIVLVCCAALLALWLNARKPGLAPEGMRALIVHAVIALALTQLIPGGESSVFFGFVVLFASALPVLVYAFLVAIWVIRFAQGALAAYR